MPIITDHDPATPACSQTCPVCGQMLRYFALNPSALLDWVEILQEDLTTLHDHLHDLKTAIESAVLP